VIDIKIDVKDLGKFIYSFEQTRRSRIYKIHEIMSLSADYILRDIRKNLSGGVLSRQTGDLYRSTGKSTVYEKGKNIFAVDVGILGRVPHKHHYGTVFAYVYGAAWEYGFTFPGVWIHAKYAKYLYFYYHKIGKWIKKKRVYVPPRTEEARPWLWPAVNKNLTRIEKLFQAWAAVDFME